MTKSKNTQSADPQSQDFQTLVNLLSDYTEATHFLTELEGVIGQQMKDVIDQHKTAYARMQKLLTTSERELEIIATRHPEWFTEKKGVKTPYGTVKFTRSTVLEIKNEELSLELIRRDAHGLTLDPENLIRTRDELDREALEDLSDEQLKAFKIRRIPKENFSVVAAKVDMGKAVKEAAEPSTATATAA